MFLSGKSHGQRISRGPKELDMTKHAPTHTHICSNGAKMGLLIRLDCVQGIWSQVIFLMSFSGFFNVASGSLSLSRMLIY